MPLTSVPLMVLAFLVTASVVAGTAWVWGRSWRLRFLPRTVGLLLIEASLLISVGLVVNREEGFYPTWDSLVASDSGDAAAPAYHTVAGSLDQQLAALPGARGGNPQALPWQPKGWSRWRLAAAPTLVVPAGYLQHPQWHYSVILVLADAAPGWPAAGQDPAVLRLAADASQDVVVFMTTTPGTTVQTLTTEVPDRLSRDLRVTGHRWAVVTSSADAPLARQTVIAAPAQYPAVATVSNTSKAVAPTRRAAAPAAKKLSSARTRTAAVARGMPAGVVLRQAAAVVGGGSVGELSVPAGIATFISRSNTVVTALAAAVGWAATQTPPPLAASSPPIRYLPVPRPHPSSSSGPAVAPSASTGRETRHGSGQRRH